MGLLQALARVNVSLQSTQYEAVGTELVLLASREWESAVKLLGRDTCPPLFTFSSSAGFFRVLLLTFLRQGGWAAVGVCEDISSPARLEPCCQHRVRKGGHFAVVEAAADKCGACSSTLACWTSSPEPFSCDLAACEIPL